MKLHENQLRLIWHLCRFSLLDYESCLYLLDTEETGDRVALSYAFRPLTKNKYLSNQKSGAVSVLKKGRALFPEEETLVSAGGGETMQRRVMQISRMALRMEEADIPCCGALQTWDTPYFIPSTCWRRIAPGLLSTTRFVGMLIWTDIRLAVYDIGDGAMECRPGRKAHCSTHDTAPMKRKRPGCSCSVGRGEKLRSQRTSSGRPCGIGSSCSTPIP